MKQLLFVACLSAMLYACGSGDAELLPMNVPKAVTAGFDTKHPDVNRSKWFKHDDGGKTFYKAEWKANGQIQHEEYDEQGNFIKALP